MRTDEPLFDLFSGPEFQSTSRFIMHMRGVLSNTSAQFYVDQEHRLNLTGRLQEPWVEELYPGRVVRMALKYDSVSEWIVSSREDMREARGPDRVVFGFHPLHSILANVGPFEDTIQGGVTFVSSGSVPLSARNHIETFILPHLIRRGFDCFQVGTIESSELFELVWSNKNSLQLLIMLAEETELEWQIVRNEAERMYDINLVEQIGASSSTFWADEVRNVLRVTRRRDRAELRSILRPIGGIPPNGVRETDIGDHVLQVVTVNTTTDRLMPHFYGLGSGSPELHGHIITEDGQWAEVLDADSNLLSAAHYLETMDGTTFTEILDSFAATGEFQVADASIFAVGDLIRIVRDQYGTLITEIPSPSALRQFGIQVGPMEMEVQGERNWVNGLFSGVADYDRVASAQVDTIQNSANININNLGSQWFLMTIPAGSNIRGLGANDLYLIDDAIVNSVGDTVLELNASVSVADNQAVYIYAWPGYLPGGWNGADSIPKIMPLFVHRGPLVPATAVLGTNYVANFPRVHLTGLTVGQVIPALTHLSMSGDSTAFPRVVQSEGIADAGGTVLLTVTQSTTAQTAGASVALTAPLFKPLPGGGTVLAFARYTIGAGIESDHFHIRHLQGNATLKVRVLHLFKSYGDAGSANMTATTSPVLKLIRHDGGTTVVASVKTVTTSPDDDLFIPPDSEVEDVLMLEWAIPEGTIPELSVRLEVWNNHPSGQANPNGVDIILGVGAYLTTDDARLIIVGSDSNRMIHHGLHALEEWSSWGAAYEATIFLLAQALGVSPSAVRPTLGGSTQIGLPSMRESLLLRITGLKLSPFERSSSVLTLERRRRLLTKEILKPRSPRLFAQVGDTMVLISKTPPTVTGVRRAGAAGVIFGPDEAGAIPIDDLPET